MKEWWSLRWVGSHFVRIRTPSHLYPLHLKSVYDDMPFNKYQNMKKYLTKCVYIFRSWVSSCMCWGDGLCRMPVQHQQCQYRKPNTTFHRMKSSHINCCGALTLLVPMGVRGWYYCLSFNWWSTCVITPSERVICERCVFAKAVAHVLYLFVNITLRSCNAFFCYDTDVSNGNVDWDNGLMLTNI